MSTRVIILGALALIALRAGYNFYQSTSNAFYGSLEITPGFFDGGRVTGVGLQVGWQHL